MKKIIFLLLLATSLMSCSRNYGNPPYNPYGYGGTRPGSMPGSGQTEGENPNVNNSDQRNPAVCEDYYNRYQLADGVNIFLSECGTLYWYNASAKICPKICWADLSLRRDGYYIRVYRMIHGEMREVEVLDCREYFCREYNILLCDLQNPDFLYQRRIQVNHSNVEYSEVAVYLRSMTSHYGVDETFIM